jgi:DNA-binding NtrC family response regulator
VPTDARRVVVCDADSAVRGAVAEALVDAGHEVAQARDIEEAVPVLATADLLLVDAGGDDAAGLVRQLRGDFPDLSVVLLTAFGSVPAAVEATRAGAAAYLVKPIDLGDLLVAVARVLQEQLLQSERRLARQSGGVAGGRAFRGVLSRDPTMLGVFDTLAAAAESMATVLLVGESGSGKSMLAKAVHQQSPRAAGPFVEVSCGSLSDTLLESELFGHVAGAFTGADRDKPGRFEAAAGGTIFLDEINSAPPAMQVKLLRVLQEKLYEPVGGNEPVRADVRVVLATNADLLAEVEAGRFRRDLYYRVNVISVELPPLRDRPADVPLLAGHFLQRFRREIGRNVLDLGGDALEILAAHDWPGSVRELENAIERAVVLCRGTTITAGDLPPTVTRPAAKSSGHFSLPLAPMPLKAALEEPERQIIRAALERHDWNRNATADELQINRTTLYKKIRKHGLDLVGAA